MSVSLATQTPSAAWLTLDRMALVQARIVSDRIWTEAKGHRTPFGAFGKLPQVEKEEDTSGSDSLLDDL
jgi:hypothetical protein